MSMSALHRIADTSRIVYKEYKINLAFGGLSIEVHFVYEIVSRVCELYQLTRKISILRH